MDKPDVIILAGPTASGKSAVALTLCPRIGGEIIAADSMQVYRGMDIGTAKPTIEEQARVCHFMLDVLSPQDGYSAAAYREGALQAEREIRARGGIPVYCGGTGLYIDAATRSMQFANESDTAVRAALKEIAAREGGKEELYRTLEAVDPETAARLHPNDVRRVARALEVFRVTGQTMAAHAAEDAQKAASRPVCMFALDWPREALYRRIDERVDQMMARGLVAEVETLRARGVCADSTAMQALGYKEIMGALDGRYDLTEAVRQIKVGTRHYAKRQLSWFRRDERVHWIPAEGRKIAEIVDEIVHTSIAMGLDCPKQS